MKLHLVSLGCAKNLVDSEVMLTRLSEDGWEITQDPADADAIIVNTCGFIEPAIDESIDTILELADYKTDGRCANLIVTGCLPQRFGEHLVQDLPEVDAFLGVAALDHITLAAKGKLNGNACLIPPPETRNFSQFIPPKIRSLPHPAYLKISEGCDRRCTYCIIPKLRGRQQSRPIADIAAEAGGLIEAGVKELVVIGHDVTHYGADLPGHADLPSLLNEIAGLSDDVWIRVLYGHPESINDDIISVIAERDNICSYFDLPIQHASDAVLKRMGRQYDRARLLDLFRRIRAAAPDAALRTAAIVGFPGETEKDVDLLQDFISKVRFDHLGLFRYSDFEDIPSHRLPGHVPEPAAQRRYDRIMTAQKAISLGKNKARIGQTVMALIEGMEEPGAYIGRTAFQAHDVDGVCYIQSFQDLPAVGFIQARITEAGDYDLTGVPV